MFQPPKAKGKVLPDEEVNMNSIRRIEDIIREYTKHPEEFNLRTVAVEVYEIARGEKE